MSNIGIIRWREYSNQDGVSVAETNIREVEDLESGPRVV